MSDFVANYYLHFQALHLIAVISWMAGMLYLPRIYVYHSEATVGGEASNTFKIMERKLLRFIMNPAMIVTWVVGFLMLKANVSVMEFGWFHIKLTLVIAMSACHGFFAVIRKKFDRDERPLSSKVFRYLNEVPTLLMIAIVFLVVVKPIF